ncbi:glycosyltransferase family 2 protein [Aeromonas hydrophila]|uniref:glycosyltransferase family 2 protein n=1 Tax=Aeromonas hydrophila TaxID=644 RepID=UPI001650CF96|nr:glycosyltransferase [Aeromonas hydrophila]
MIDVSVVLPVYNAELYLSEAIESVLAQSYRNIELIIVNDGSTDNSFNIIENFKNQDNRVRVISRENKGLIYSLNEGIAASKGRYIARMDADDICFLDRLEKQVKYMDSNRLDICGGHYLEINEAGTVQRIRFVPINSDIINLSLVSRVPFAHPSVVFRKSFIDENNLCYGCDKFKHAEDLALWFAFAACGAKFGNVNDVILKYRVLDSSLSRRNRSNLIKDTRIINRLHYINCNKNNIELAGLRSMLNNKDDARILSEFIWHGFFFDFKASLLTKLPFRRFNSEVFMAFLRQLKIFIGG